MSAPPHPMAICLSMLEYSYFIFIVATYFNINLSISRVFILNTQIAISYSCKLRYLEPLISLVEPPLRSPLQHLFLKPPAVIPPDTVYEPTVHPLPAFPPPTQMPLTSRDHEGRHLPPFLSRPSLLSTGPPPASPSPLLSFAFCPSSALRHV